MALPDEENTQLTRFRAQYLQVLDPGTLSWPPHAMLKKANVQAWLFKNLFDKQNLQYLPSDRYQARVLKIVLSRIEESIEDTDQDVSAITSNPCMPSSSAEQRLNVGNEIIRPSPFLHMFFILRPVSLTLVLCYGLMTSVGDHG